MNKKYEIDNKAIGQKIRHEREKFGLSREQFAEIIGLSDYYVGQLERGERQMSLPVLVKITNCLHMSLDYLVFGKMHDHSYHVYETPNTTEGYLDPKTQIHELINKCSTKELELVNKLIKTILPYI